MDCKKILALFVFLSLITVNVCQAAAVTKKTTKATKSKNQSTINLKIGTWGNIKIKL